mgnify:CR=1 FL=1
MAHDHVHTPPADLGPAFRWAVVLNTAYVLIEGTAGFLTGSLALLADAAHNLTDVAGLLIAWGAAVLAKRAGHARYTFGYGRATILAAMLNGTAILVGVGLVIWKASQRFASPVEVPGLTVMLMALIGIGVNTGSALLFMRSQKDDLNAKGAFLHMAADAAVSGAVVLAAAGILYTGWQWLDPAVAIAVSLLIAFTALGPDARRAAAGTGRRARKHRPAGGGYLDRRAGRRQQRARPAYLGACHHPHGAGRACGLARC